MNGGMNRTMRAIAAQGFALGIGGVPAAHAQWAVQTVDDDGEVGSSPTLGVNDAGQMFYAYRDTTLDTLRCAYPNATGNWTTEMVEPAFSGRGGHASIAVDPDGTPHISYYDAFARDLRYARRDGAAWLPAVVDDVGQVGEYSSITFSEFDGAPHIVYYDRTNLDFKHAWLDGAVWENEVVHGAGAKGKYTSVVAADDGWIYASYYDESNQDLMVARRTPGGAWAWLTVDSAGFVGMDTSIALLPDGRRMVAYRKWDPATNRNSLKWAVGAAGVWSTITIDSAGSVGNAPSLTADADGNTHISYYDLTNKDLKHARWDPVAVKWVIEVVASAGDVGKGSSMELDPATGDLLIAYHDATNGWAMLAEQAPESAGPVSVPAPTADLDRDGRVDLRDAAAFGALLRAADPAADLNADGCVSALDLSVFLRNLEGAGR